MMQSLPNALAPGIDLFPSLRPPNKTLDFHRGLVLFLTFLAYASFHASRKPPSIVKSVLGPGVRPDNATLPASGDAGWAPFDGLRGTHRLGELDVAFLSFYSLGMYFAGHIGDRIDLRQFLVFGMIGSGILTVVFGLGYWLDVHVLAFFLVVQILSGLFQSIGWPCVVSVVGNWSDKANRGFTMGVWNSHTSFGNIVGSVIASALLEYGWGWSFLVPGILLISLGVLVCLFLVVRPRDLGFEAVEGDGVQMGVEESGAEKPPVSKLTSGDRPAESEVTGLLPPDNVQNASPPEAIGFLAAWRLPGVAHFSLCLFFSKLVAYTFLYWLPFYIRHTAVAGVHLSHKTAGMLSTIFDIGGVFGGISAGYVSDALHARASTSMIFLVLSIPALVCYRTYGSISMFANVSLMFISGVLVNGPYALITTAVAADIGTQVGGNARALATVTAIIDGTGSVGAAFGPLLAGYLSTIGWNAVFTMLVLSIISACLSLKQLVGNETVELLHGTRLWNYMEQVRTYRFLR